MHKRRSPVLLVARVAGRPRQATGAESIGRAAGVRLSQNMLVASKACCASNSPTASHKHAADEALGGLAAQRAQRRGARRSPRQQRLGAAQAAGLVAAGS